MSSLTYTLNILCKKSVLDTYMQLTIIYSDGQKSYTFFSRFFFFLWAPCGRGANSGTSRFCDLFQNWSYSPRGRPRKNPRTNVQDFCPSLQCVNFVSSKYAILALQVTLYICVICTQAIYQNLRLILVYGLCAYGTDIKWAEVHISHRVIVFVFYGKR